MEKNQVIETSLDQPSLKLTLLHYCQLSELSNFLNVSASLHLLLVGKLKLIDTMGMEKWAHIREEELARFNQRLDMMVRKREKSIKVDSQVSGLDPVGQWCHP